MKVKDSDLIWSTIGFIIGFTLFAGIFIIIGFFLVVNWAMLST